MATLIKNHTTGQWDTVNKDYSVAFGYPGQLIDFAGPAENFTHQGWLLCDGTEYNVGDYPALYAAIGNTYGGTADSTFCVPDYRETVRVGAGTSTRTGVPPMMYMM